MQEQIQPGVDNAWRESRGDIGKGMESVPSGGGSQDIIADHQGHQAIIEQRTQDSNIRNDVKHQVDNMVTEYKGNIGDTQNSIRGEENIVRGQYSELQNHHKTGNDSNLLIVFYVQIMPDDFVMQLHRF
ncbi:hypothetical protein WP3W18E07_P10770 (plasmid) [Escherichia coli]|nr:hypothetical protein WP3W18E07_P10770 [Escherichia coli]BBR32933.1 hypothetical protein WP3S18E08_P10780 [Escherichia coli]